MIRDDQMAAQQVGGVSLTTRPVDRHGVSYGAIERVYTAACIRDPAHSLQQFLLLASLFSSTRMRLPQSVLYQRLARPQHLLSKPCFVLQERAEEQ